MSKKNYKSKKVKYTAAEKRAYWAGVGAGFSQNQNGIPYWRMRKDFCKTPAMSESFSAGFNRSYDRKK